MSLREHVEVGGQRVRGNSQQAREIAGGEPFRLMFDQQAECLQPGALGKSAERIEGRNCFHKSRIAEQNL